MLFGSSQNSALGNPGFYATYVPRLTRHFTRVTGDEMLAEDLVQEACAVALARFGQDGVAVAQNPAGYLFGVVRRLYLGKLRKDKRQATDSVAQVPELGAPDTVEGSLERERQQHWLANQINALPRARDRELLTRLVLYQQDKACICDALGLSARHYDRVLSRALDRLVMRCRKA